MHFLLARMKGWHILRMKKAFALDVVFLTYFPYCPTSTQSSWLQSHFRWNEKWYLARDLVTAQKLAVDRARKLAGAPRAGADVGFLIEGEGGMFGLWTSNWIVGTKFFHRCVTNLVCGHSKKCGSFPWTSYPLNPVDSPLVCRHFQCMLQCNIVGDASIKCASSIILLTHNIFVQDL